jgi:hypothetical protein
LGPALGVDLAPGTDVVTAGVGLFGDGAGTVSIDIPAGATVEQVLLYWGGRATDSDGDGTIDRDDTIEVESFPVLGRHIGAAALVSTDLEGFSYRADITDLIDSLGGFSPGTNLVELSGFEDPAPGGRFRSDGASIVAVIRDGSDTVEFQLRDGADMAFVEYDPPADGTVKQDYLFAPADEVRTAKLLLIVGDTDTLRPDRLIIWVDDVVFLDQYNYFQELAGAQWSNREQDVTIPAGATKVSVQLFSEDDPDGVEERAESLMWIVGGLVLSLPVNENPGCTLTQGYWKTHSERGPAPYDETWALLADGADTDFFETDASWHTVFHTPPRRGNAYIQLAHQWMAATLNGLNGADDSAVASELAEGADLLDAYDSDWNDPRAIRNASQADFERMGELAGILDDYNNGLIGPGHCDDGIAEATPARSSSQAAAEMGVVAYPNPMRDRATLSLTLAEQAPVSVAIYDVMGRRVALLADEVLSAGTHQLPFDASSLANGVYVYRVEMPNGVETGRLSVLR